MKPILYYYLQKTKYGVSLGICFTPMIAARLNRRRHPKKINFYF
jgi:hypothetical protein